MGDFKWLVARAIIITNDGNWHTKDEELHVVRFVQLVEEHLISRGKCEFIPFTIYQSLSIQKLGSSNAQTSICTYILEAMSQPEMNIDVWKQSVLTICEQLKYLLGDERNNVNLYFLDVRDVMTLKNDVKYIYE